MGLFNNKNKLYSLEKALKLLNSSTYKDYTTIPVGDKFKLVLENNKKYQEKVYKSKMNIKREEFIKKQTKNIHINYDKGCMEYGQGYWQSNNYHKKNNEAEMYR